MFLYVLINIYLYLLKKIEIVILNQTLFFRLFLNRDY